MQKSEISNLRRQRDYYLQDGPAWVRSIWVKPESFNWFLKNNRSALTQRGAIVRLGRDYFIDIVAFPEVAVAALGLNKHGEEFLDE